MELLKKLMGGEKKKARTDSEPTRAASKRAATAAAGAAGYEAGAAALSPRGKVSPDQFKKAVAEAVKAGLTRESFETLRGQYQALGNLQKYAISSWMVAEYPELEQAIRAGDFGVWEAMRE